MGRTTVNYISCDLCKREEREENNELKIMQLNVPAITKVGRTTDSYISEQTIDVCESWRDKVIVVKVHKFSDGIDFELRNEGRPNGE